MSHETVCNCSDAGLSADDADTRTAERRRRRSSCRRALCRRQICPIGRSHLCRFECRTDAAVRQETTVSSNTVVLVCFLKRCLQYSYITAVWQMAVKIPTIIYYLLENLDEVHFHTTTSITCSLHINIMSYFCYYSSHSQL